MGLFDFFRSHLSPAPAVGASPGDPPANLPPEKLRELLFDLAVRRETAKLCELCRAWREEILRHFPAWKFVPEPIRKDRAAVQRYAEGLFGLATAFRDALGDDQLVRMLEDAPADSPLARWDETLGRAKALMEEMRYDDARDLLNNLLIDVRHLVSVGQTSYHGLTHGHLATCLFSSGRVPDARPHYERALALCAEQGDRDGVRAYVGALYEVHRYLTESAAAADYATRYGQALREEGRVDEAVEWEAQARRVRSGEPPNRVVASIDGRRYELDDVPHEPGDVSVSFHFVRNRPSLRLCEQLVEEGGRAGSRDDFYGALDAFRRAARVDPFDPQPRYEEGVTLMHLDRAAEAAEAFAAADELAPGWYNCRGDRWVAERVAAGAVPQAVYLLLRLEDASPESASFEQRVRLAERALSEFPRFAPIHFLRGRALEALERDEEAAAAFAAGLDCAEEPDVRTRLLLYLHRFLESDDEKRRLLAEAAALAATGNLMAASMARVTLQRMSALEP